MRVFGMPISRTGRRKSENKFNAFRMCTHTQTEHIYDIYYNISHSCLSWVMGFGIPQEIFNETYQRPLIVNKETQAETQSRLRGRISTGAARISWERICCRWRSLNFYSCGMPKPITHDRPFNRWFFKALTGRYCSSVQGPA